MTRSAEGARPIGEASDVAASGYELTLFVNGATDLSARAIANARAVCDWYPPGGFRLSVVDIHEQAAAALQSRVVVAPTLVRTAPLPVRRVVGDLSNPERVLRALDLPPAPATPA